jgi:hypothetical protein
VAVDVVVWTVTGFAVVAFAGAALILLYLIKTFYYIIK